MNDISNTNWASMTDNALMLSIGKFVQYHRLKQNITQAQLAKSATISRSTLSLLENGEKITLATLLQVLRVLDLLHVMDAFQIKEEISPLEYLKLQKNKRQRARNTPQKNDEEEAGW